MYRAVPLFWLTAVAQPEPPRVASIHTLATLVPKRQVMSTVTLTGVARGRLTTSTIHAMMSATRRASGIYRWARGDRWSATPSSTIMGTSP